MARERFTARDHLKVAAYRSGVVPSYHRWRNRNALTVVMFHRVLPEEDERWAVANPEYTVSAQLLRDCLRFLKRHYNVIDAAAVDASLSGVCPLPDYPALVTFDDGWADNEEIALPILRAESVPATVFVVSSAIDSPDHRWWPEFVAQSVAQGRLDARRMALMWNASGPDMGSFPNGSSTIDQSLALIARLSQIPALEREQILHRHLPEGGKTIQREMLTRVQLRHLVEAGITIGSHGATHASLPALADPRSELALSRQQLATQLGRAPGNGPDIISFPNGRYNDRVVAASRDAGFRLLFTSDQCLNPAPQGFLKSDLLGRIPISARMVGDGFGRLRPELIALWLMRRSHLVLAPKIDLRRR